MTVAGASLDVEGGDGLEAQGHPRRHGPGRLSAGPALPLGLVAVPAGARGQGRRPWLPKRDGRERTTASCAADPSPPRCAGGSQGGTKGPLTGRLGPGQGNELVTPVARPSSAAGRWFALTCVALQASPPCAEPRHSVP